MAPVRRSDLSLFAVDDRSAQVVWRGLPPGPLHLAVRDGDGRTVAASVPTIGPHPEVPGAGAPGATVLEPLPAGAHLVLEARPPEPAPPVRLALRTAPRLAGEELCRFATVSDLHVGATVFGHRGTIAEPRHPDGPHPVRCTRAALAELGAWGASRLVVKGDLTDHAALGQWRRCASLLAEATVPVDVLPGNHDRDHPHADAPLDATDAAAVFGLALADPVLVRDLPGARLLLADTCIPGSNRGTLDRVGDDLLDAAADADDDVAVLVAIHHQLEPRTGAEGWPIGIPHREGRRFLERLARAHPRSFVTSGHTHRHRRWRHAGITTTQVGSVKDYPGVWAGYTVAEGGLAQLVRRIQEPSCLVWTDRTRRAAAGAWRFIAPGPADSRTFALPWPLR